MSTSIIAVGCVVTVVDSVKLEKGSTLKRFPSFATHLEEFIVKILVSRREVSFVHSEGHLTGGSLEPRTVVLGFLIFRKRGISSLL